MDWEDQASSEYDPDLRKPSYPQCYCEVSDEDDIVYNYMHYTKLKRLLDDSYNKNETSGGSYLERLVAWNFMDDFDQCFSRNYCRNIKSVL